MKAEHRTQLSDAFRWALEDTSNASVASADWLARDIDPSHESAAEMIADRDVTLAKLKKAKNAFKTMRIVGETPADRRIGARFYAASIAAALVRFDVRISTQSDNALVRGLTSLRRDTRMPVTLRDLAESAIRKIRKAG